MKSFPITKNEHGKLVALHEEDQPYFARHKRAMIDLEQGEIMQYHCEKSPSHPLNAWHHILIGEVFKAQERFTDVRAFRQFLYLAAGYGEEVRIGRKRTRVPGSWSFDAIKDDFERSEVHNKVVMAMYDVDVLREIWPHLRPAKRLEMIMTTIQEAEKQRAEYKARAAMKRAQESSKVDQNERVEA